MRKFISTVLSAVVLMGLVGFAAPPQVSSAAPIDSAQSTQSNNSTLSPNVPEAAGDDISFVQSHTVLRFGNDRNFNTGGVAKGDFNGDGKLDLAVTGTRRNTSERNAGYLYIVLSNGDGTFQGAAQYPAPATPTGGDAGNYCPLAKDFDGDGKLDVVMTATEIKKVAFFKGRGDGNFLPAVTADFPEKTNCIQAADLNGDGKLDLVSSDYEAKKLMVAFGNGDGTFQAAASYALHGNPNGIALGDVNGDGKSDIVYSAYNDPKFGVLLNNGSGGFPALPLQISIGGKNVVNLTLADFSGDGKLDVLATANGGVSGTTSWAAVLVRGNGTGTFQAPVLTDYTNDVALLARMPGSNENVAPDLNGDGKLDLALKLQSQVQIMLAPFPATADAESTPFYTMTLTPGDFDINTDLNNHVHAADLDGDGKVDLLAHTRNGGTDNLEFFKGNGNGAFAGAVSAGSGYGDIFSYVTRDLDGDGKLDLVAAGNYAIWVAKGVGDGTFFAPTAIGVYGGAQQMVLADFNGDNKPDIVATYSGNGIQIHPGKGDGTFGPPLYFAKGTSRGASGIMAGDVNGDGKPDLVTENGRNDEERFHETVLINNSGPQADLVLVMSASRAVVTKNTPVRFIATITNTGSSTAQNVTLRNLLPASSWTLDSAVASQGSCANTAGVVSCVVGSMPFSTTQVVTLTARPIVTGVLAGTARISSTAADPELGDNSAAAQIVVTEPPAWLTAGTISASAAVASANANGKPVLRMPASKRSPVTVTFTMDKLKLPGVNNSNVNNTLIKTSVRHGNQTFVMIETVTTISISIWTYTIPPDQLVTGPVIIVVIICGTTCGDDDDYTVEWEWVYIELYDPSGIVSDRATAKPIENATVTLFKVPGALPDEGGATKQCRTIDTRPGGAGGNWDGLPAANEASGVLPDLLFDPGEISPVINPQKTNNEGYFGWNVAKGCWFVKVEATGYKTVISALVGVPPAVTDLNIKLDKTSGKVFLPLLRK